MSYAILIYLLVHFFYVIYLSVSVNFYSFYFIYFHVPLSTVFFPCFSTVFYRTCPLYTKSGCGKREEHIHYLVHGVS